MLAVVILAAGKGSRMKSDRPKVLQELGGKSLIERVLLSCRGLNLDKRILVIGHKADQVKDSLKDDHDLEFVIQKEQMGTGHAVQQTIPNLKDFTGDLLVLNGDVPLLRSETLEKLLKEHRTYAPGVTLLSARLRNPKGYGRVFANQKNYVEEIIEDKDCSIEQKQNTLTNAGIYCFNWNELRLILPSLDNKNSQNEIYITDAISMLNKARHIEVDDPEEVSGINNKVQLSICESLLQKRLREDWMKQGVTFIDPTSCTVNDNCTFGRDIVIEPQTHIKGKCHIGDQCTLGPNSLIINSTIGNNVSVVYSVVRDSNVGSDVAIGPFAHLRPNANISDGCRIGNFVEVKNSQIGEGSKVNHLTYLGDAVLGKKVNIGAGTITANYDGLNKHRTVIGDQTKTGANSVFVAPINIGSNVTIGAGSTITKDVPKGSLAISRSKQLIKNNWSK